MWLCTVETRQPTLRLISTKMTSSWRALLQKKLSLIMLNWLMKDSTSATFLVLENHLEAGWLSKVRHDSVTKQHNEDILQVVWSGWVMMIHSDDTVA